jgi:UDP-N-acetyl-2-amino-2-deoxyglucuronate dehydrogenase
MSQKDTLKFAVLGFGHMGKRHAELIHQNEHTELTAIIDHELKPEELSSFAEISTFNDLTAFLAGDKITDVVVIATPNGLHARHAELCLHAEKNVLIEKPIALHTADIEILFKLAEKVNKRIFAGWQLRFSPLMIVLKKILDEKKLGKIYWVQADCFWSRGDSYYKGHPWHGTKKLDGGPLFTQFSHILHILAWIVGPMELKRAQRFKLNNTVKTEFEDSGMLNLSTQDIESVNLNYSTCSFDGSSNNELTIIAELGTIKIEGQYLNKIISCHTKDTDIFNQLNSVYNGKEVNKYCGNKQLEFIVQELQKKSESSEYNIIENVIFNIESACESSLTY